MKNRKETTLGELEKIGYDWAGMTLNTPTVYNNPLVWGVDFTPETKVTVRRDGAVYFYHEDGTSATLAFGQPTPIDEEDWESINN